MGHERFWVDPEGNAQDVTKEKEGADKLQKEAKAKLSKPFWKQILEKGDERRKNEGKGNPFR